MSDTVLKVDHVTMQFGGVVAVDDLNLEVNRHEIVSLIDGKTVVKEIYVPKKLVNIVVK